MHLELQTASPDQTECLGETLAALLPAGTLIALYGDLATGKTCLVRGMARYAGGSAPVHSPTFTLVNQYGDERPLYHLDLYRLGGPDMLADLGYEEIFDGTGLCAVEWAERAEGLLPEARVEIHLEHAGGDRRSIRITALGVALPQDATARMQQAIGAAIGA